MTQGEERSRWKVHADRVVDQNPHLRLSIASVELPDGTRFDQYVARMPRCAMTVVLDEGAERTLGGGRPGSQFVYRPARRSGSLLT